ncbi:hypothetical protein QRX50_09160 [Amycolatopsis carbonis]|uniref:DUF4189 domain-containing protein n=1 Tax=Amycolatopsis carbonis TaxID=715471 RepID=A0A9Y2IJ58_9PSEU|nr:hypothetical protein [Amycolatopsis sp. 2-15]WIX80909.1 hypothetical protein QRX50_09160 [Amycolatopsis sp. 2-15]
MGTLRETIAGTFVAAAVLAVVAPAASAAPAGFRWNTFTGTGYGTYAPAAVQSAELDARNQAGLNGYNDCSVSGQNVEQTLPDQSPSYTATVTLNCSQTTPDA